MITVFSEKHHLQFGQYELIDGKLVTPFECPQRMDAIMQRIADVNLGDVIEPQAFGLEPVTGIHTEAFVEFMRTAHDKWRERHGDSDALPICWPTRTLRQKCPKEIDGLLSYYSFDAGTPITAGTWGAITASVDVALTGADLIRRGESSVFSACRPPGHHASAEVYGGYCFFNNAAVAVQALIDGGAERVALLDIDYHHGNGSQAIFYDRDDVLYVSLHGDPRQEFPFFLGYGDETGRGAGRGFTCNYPMPWGTEWKDYGEALDRGLARIRAFSPDILVVSLGVDTFEKDPISKFKLKSDRFQTVGEKIARETDRPCLFIMEGGYAVEEIGINVVNVLTGYLNA
ncbi:MAG: histone deacetylase family protein [Deltaproteobacteria bacterium]|nr:histone deacetylase family protein [Deltaproteobacteria bacterium]